MWSSLWKLLIKQFFIYYLRLHFNISVRDPWTFFRVGFRFQLVKVRFYFVRSTAIFSWSVCESLIWVSLIPFFLVIYIIVLDGNTKEAQFRKTILKRTQERSVNSTNDQFRFHTLQNFHLTFDLRQLSKISSFHPFLTNRKNVSTVAFSPKMRTKLRVQGLGRIYEPAKNEFCWFEFWDLY